MLLYKKVLKYKLFDSAGLLTKWVNETEADVSNITYNANRGSYTLFYWKMEIASEEMSNQLANSSTIPILQS